MKSKMTDFLTVTFAFAALFCGAGMAHASTADGQTPAEETVCDVYSGAAFGLCNAYCEAMDCELLDDGDDFTNPNASVNACMKVKDNFMKITGETALPCDCPAGNGQFGCPCTGDLDCGGDLVCDPENNLCVEDDPGEA